MIDVRDGRIVRLELHESGEDALDASGLGVRATTFRGIPDAAPGSGGSLLAMPRQILTLELDGLTAADYIAHVSDPEPPALGYGLRTITLRAEPRGQHHQGGTRLRTTAVCRPTHLAAGPAGLRACSSPGSSPCDGPRAAHDLPPRQAARRSNRVGPAYSAWARSWAAPPQAAASGRTGTARIVPPARPPLVLRWASTAPPGAGVCLARDGRRPLNLPATLTTPSSTSGADPRRRRGPSAPGVAMASHARPTRDQLRTA